MSTHYLLSLDTDEIVDVSIPVTTPPRTVLNGQYVIRVPDEIPVKNPTSRADLLDKKYAGILSSVGMFTSMDWDDMLDPTGIDLAESSQVVTGYRGANAIRSLGSLQTQVAFRNLSGQACIVYEAYTYEYTHGPDGIRRVYVEELSDTSVGITLNLDGQSPITGIVSGVPFSIPTPSNWYSITFTSTVTRPVYLGSWAFLY